MQRTNLGTRCPQESLDNSLVVGAIHFINKD